MLSQLGLSEATLIEIIRVQQEIVETDLALEHVMNVVARAALRLAGADAPAVELMEGDAARDAAALSLCAREHEQLTHRAERDPLTGLANREHLELAMSTRIRRDQPFTIAASAGLAVFPADGETSSALLRVADARMYERKRARC